MPALPTREVEKLSEMILGASGFSKQSKHVCDLLLLNIISQTTQQQQRCGNTKSLFDETRRYLQLRQYMTNRKEMEE